MHVDAVVVCNPEAGGTVPDVTETSDTLLYTPHPLEALKTGPPGPFQGSWDVANKGSVDTGLEGYKARCVVSGIHLLHLASEERIQLHAASSTGTELPQAGDVVFYLMQQENQAAGFPSLSPFYPKAPSLPLPTPNSKARECPCSCRNEMSGSHEWGHGP